MSKTGFAKEHLRSFVDRVERLNEEREALSADIREVFSEAKGTGFDCKILRQVIRLRKLDRADFQEQEAMLDLYLTALDMRSDAPLLDSVEERQAEMAGPDDELYVKAVEIARTDNKGSTSYIQRRLQIGYNRAASLIERMEQDGILSAPDRNGVRTVIAADQELTAKLVEKIAQGIQTKAGQSALLAAVDTMIEREEARELPAFLDRRAKPPPVPA